MHKRRGVVLAAAIALARAVVVFADSVSLSDGSVLVGSIQHVAKGKLILETAFAGTLELDMSLVRGFTTEDPVHVRVAAGDVLVGPVRAGDHPDRVVVASGFGDVPVDPAAIDLMWSRGRESPEVIALREKAQAELAAARPQWSMTLEAGATRTEGNTDTLEGRGRFDLKRETSDDLLHFYLAAKYGEQNNERTTNEYFGGIKYENRLTERKYWYARTELEFDEFENLDLRATAAAGLGYFWIKKTEQEFKSRVGGGYRHESFDDGLQEDDAILDLGLDYRVDLAEWVQFTHSTTYTPDVEDFDNYRLNFDTALLFPLKDDRWKWKLGMRNDYNTQPQRGLDRLDNTYYTSIVLALK